MIEARHLLGGERRFSDEHVGGIRVGGRVGSWVQNHDVNLPTALHVEGGCQALGWFECSMSPGLCHTLTLVEESAKAGASEARANAVAPLGWIDDELEEGTPGCGGPDGLPRWIRYDHAVGGAIAQVDEHLVVEGGMAVDLARSLGQGEHPLLEACMPLVVGVEAHPSDASRHCLVDVLTCAGGS